MPIEFIVALLIFAVVMALVLRVRELLRRDLESHNFPPKESKEYNLTVFSAFDRGKPVVWQEGVGLTIMDKEKKECPTLITEENSEPTKK